MALLPACEPGMSRRAMLGFVDAAVALDLLESRMATIYSADSRPYPATMNEVRKMYRDAARKSAPTSDAEVVRRSIASMAKYRKRTG